MEGDELGRRRKAVIVVEELEWSKRKKVAWTGAGRELQS